MNEPIDEWAWLQRPGTAQAPANGIAVRSRLTTWSTMPFVVKLTLIVLALWAVVLVLWVILDFSRTWPLLFVLGGVLVGAYLWWKDSAVTIQSGRVSIFGRAFDESQVTRVEPNRLSLSGSSGTAFMFKDKADRTLAELWTTQLAQDDLGKVLAPFAGRVTPTKEITLEDLRGARQVAGSPRGFAMRPIIALIVGGVLAAAGFVILQVMNR